MPPKNTVALNERETQAIVAAFKHNKNAFEIDYEGYAATLGLASAASARSSWASLRKKLGVGADSKASDSATGKKRKAAAAESEDDDAGDDDDDDDDDVPKTLKKKTTKAAKEKKGKKSAKEVKDEDEDDE